MLISVGATTATAAVTAAVPISGTATMLARIRKRGFLITRRFVHCVPSTKRSGLSIRDIASIQVGGVGA